MSSIDSSSEVASKLVCPTYEKFSEIVVLPEEASRRENMKRETRSGVMLPQLSPVSIGRRLRDTYAHMKEIK